VNLEVLFIGNNSISKWDELNNLVKIASINILNKIIFLMFLEGFNSFK
jgi:hypothetical protein